MSVSSSTSISSERSRSPSAFWRRLALFALPYAVFLCVLTVLVVRTGEFSSAADAALQQTNGAIGLYGAMFSDANFHFKVQSARLRKPDVLVIGASRVNQWRSRMFAPYSFYNGANSAYIQRDYRRFLEALGKVKPRVLIFSLDPYTFSSDWDPIFANVNYGEGATLGSSKQITILKGVLKELIKEPWISLSTTEPLYGLPAAGLEAIRNGVGFRYDGSLQYGSYLSGDAVPVSVRDAVNRVTNGIPPFQYAEKMDPANKLELERFSALARSEGIALVAVTMPYSPELMSALDRSTKHEMWRQFQSDETVKWIRQQGVLYFDFSRLSSFGGRAVEFVDPFHASEPAYLRMLLTMLQDPAFKTLVPDIDEADLRIRLATATKYEVYRNEF